jgi:hypothetical protein
LIHGHDGLEFNAKIGDEKEHRELGWRGYWVEGCSSDEHVEQVRARHEHVMTEVLGLHAVPC